MENYVLKQICTQDNTLLRLYITILNDSVELTIFQEENAWKSTVLKKNLQRFATEHKVTLENYGLKLLEYVKNVTPEVVFIFKNEEFVVNLVVKSSLQVTYVQHVEQVMDRLYRDNTTSSEQVKNFKKENEEITKQKIDCETKLKELVTKKISDENEQLGHFMLILNEKKRRIQHLTELLEAFKKGRPTANPVIKVSNRNRKKGAKTAPLVQKKETISDSESTNSNEAFSSDDHTSGSNSVAEKSTAADAKPSTSTEAFDFLEDDFAQSHILPKRIKLPKPEQDVKITSQQAEPPAQEQEVVSTERSKSPGIDLSTQQLLDML